MSILPGSVRGDGWYSTLTGLGVPGYDKRESTGFGATFLTEFTVEQLWRSDDIAARIIETIPEEMVRKGYKVKIEGEKDQAEDICAALEELGADVGFANAKKFERAYGGGAIFPYANDGEEDLSQPLNEDKIKAVEHLIVLEPRELSPVSYYNDPTKKKFGQVRTYRLQPFTLGGSAGRSQEIHETRLITFDGIRVNRTYRGMSGWGDSAMNRVWSVLRDFNTAFGGAGVLLHDFGQTVIKIKGLAELMAQDRDSVVQTRLRTIELSRSTIRAVLMDAEEDLERKQTSVAGLAELLDRFATRLAAASDMPVTLLMGQSPAGLNATGESDIRFFYDRVARHQELGLKRQVERLVKLIMLSKSGPTKGKEPDTWSVEFNPLWQPSEKEQADTRMVQASIDEKYINLNVVTADEIAHSRFGGDTYSTETHVDFEERERLAKEMAAMEPEIDPVTGMPIAPAAPPASAPSPFGEPSSNSSGKVTSSPKGEVEEADVQVGDVDGDGKEDEYVVINVQGHQRRVKLRRKRTDADDLDTLLGPALAASVKRALSREDAEDEILDLSPELLGPELWAIVGPMLDDTIVRFER